MKILLRYLKPYKWLVGLTLFLAAINTAFSLFDPIILGKLVRLAGDYNNTPTDQRPVEDFFGSSFFYGVIWLLLASIGVAMVSRIAKNFQDYFLNVIVRKL